VHILTAARTTVAALLPAPSFPVQAFPCVILGSPSAGASLTAGADHAGSNAPPALARRGYPHVEHKPSWLGSLPCWELRCTSIYTKLKGSYATPLLGSCAAPRLILKFSVFGGGFLPVCFVFSSRGGLLPLARSPICQQGDSWPTLSLKKCPLRQFFLFV